MKSNFFRWSGFGTTCIYVLVPILLQVGCSFTGDDSGPIPLRGERAAYSVINAAGPPTMHSPRLLALPDNRLLYANRRLLSRTRRAVQTEQSGDLNFASDPGHESLHWSTQPSPVFVPAGDAHRIPKYAILQWAIQPSAFAVMRPLSRRIAIRSVIADDVLSLVQNPWRYRIDIQIAVTGSRTAVGWRLLDVSVPPVRELRRGGHWP